MFQWLGGKHTTILPLKLSITHSTPLIHPDMKKKLLAFVLVLFTATRAQAQLTVNAGPDRVICGVNVTSIGVTNAVTVGTPPYTYQWSPSASLSNPAVAVTTASPTTTTMYYLTVTDNVGQTGTDSVLVTVRPELNVAINANPPVSCAVPAAINFLTTLVGGGPVATYNWSFGDGTTSNLPNPVHAYASQGFYTVILQVQDSMGCADTTFTQVQITPPPVIISTGLNVSCNGGTNGAIDLTVTGGSPPYTFLWSNGMTTEDALGMTAGTYTVTVADGNGCTATNITTVNEPTPLTLGVTATDESVQGACDGQISVTASGGTTPYSYTWSNSSTTQTVTNVCAGVYTLTVTDANGCTVAGLGTVGSNCANNTLSLSITSQDLSCSHPSDTMVLHIAGGTPPFTSYWNTGINGDTNIVNSAGVYTAFVVDSNGCSKSISDTLLNLGIVITGTGITPVTCNGINDGEINVSVTGGTPPYTYLWSNSSTADSLTNTPSGFYTLTVTDASLCSAQAGYNLPQSNTNWSYYVYASATSANCGNTGTATAMVYGGTPPFSFLWINSDTSQIITGLAPGTYMVTVTGSDGCIRTGVKSVSTTCYNVIQGYLFSDTNGNCLKDNGEQGAGYITITATNGNNTYYGYANNVTGYFKINCAASGTFNLSFSTSNNGCSNIAVCSIAPITFSGLGDTVNTNIGFGSNGGYDLAIHPGWTSANPGFTKQYWVLYNQQGTPTYTGPAVITFTYDTVLQYQSSTQGGIHNAANHTITWNLAAVPSNWVAWANRPMAYFTVPANTPIGYQLRQDFRITPTANDCDTADNHLLSIQPVTGSMDPNEKEVSPAGDIQEEDSVLTYTIHFQNTGNDTTSFVILKDTLSTHVNPVTVVNLASSHAYSSFDITDNGILTWIFNPIFLVDSATNEPESKGFVMFSIKKMPNLPLNTQIQNKASIYFDYNEPIVTNTVSSKLTNPDNIWSLTNDADIEVSAAPNPFTQSTLITVDGVTTAFSFELYDVSGKLLKSIPTLNESRFVIHRGDITQGVYFYTITTANKQKAYGRLAIQ